MKVVWTDTAIENLEAIHAYIARHSPQYALGIVDRLTKRTQQLANFPRSGRIVPEFDNEQIREIIENPYRIIYWVRSEQIEILAIVHGSRKILRSDGEEN
ncbi:MAG: type II toxin-antitoxin system RelE/ParE family toxin [Cyanobacteria bacterium P01_E01_bin.42]